MLQKRTPEPARRGGRAMRAQQKKQGKTLRLGQFLKKAAAEKAARFSVTFDAKLDRAVRAAAGDNISAWLADAARDRLRFEAAAEFVREFESHHGKISDELLDEVEREWPR